MRHHSLSILAASLCLAFSATTFAASTNINTGTRSKVVYVKVLYYSGGTGATNGKYTSNLKW